jgi:hypothetical protein
MLSLFPVTIPVIPHIIAWFLGSVIKSYVGETSARYFKEETVESKQLYHRIQMNLEREERSGHGKAKTNGIAFTPVPEGTIPGAM